MADQGEWQRQMVAEWYAFQAWRNHATWWGKLCYIVTGRWPRG